MDRFIIKGEKQLRYGYTTGTCAALASKAAVKMLLSNSEESIISINTPKGWEIKADVVHIKLSKDIVSCAVQKDSGDDPDITNGILIYSKVELIPTKEFILTGGEGVGVATRKGLSVEVGQPAINPVPKEMILNEVKKLAIQFNYEGGFLIEISVPEGEKLAKKTFNPKLGIEGGISIIGTTGIVEPMSEKALIDTLKLEIKVLKNNGVNNLLLFPGNYGKKFAGEILDLNTSHSVKISNYIGEVLDSIDALEFERVLLVAHAGKLIKVAGGIMNTHSRFADSRMEIMAAYTSLCGGDSNLTAQILNAITTDEAIDIIKNEDYYSEIIKKILERVQYHICNKLEKPIKIGIVMFTNTHGLLGINEQAKHMLNLYK